jgi:ribosomal protein S27E
MTQVISFVRGRAGKRAKVAIMGCPSKLNCLNPTLKEAGSGKGEKCVSCGRMLVPVRRAGTDSSLSQLFLMGCPVFLQQCPNPTFKKAGSGEEKCEGCGRTLVSAGSVVANAGERVTVLRNKNIMQSPLVVIRNVLSSGEKKREKFQFNR